MKNLLLLFVLFSGVFSIVSAQNKSLTENVVITANMFFS